MKNRNNAWGLVGLQQSYLAQGKMDQARALESKINAFWPNRISRPSSSCFCEPGQAYNGY